MKPLGTEGQSGGSTISVASFFPHREHFDLASTWLREIDPNPLIAHFPSWNNWHPIAPLIKISIGVFGYNEVENDLCEYGSR